MLSNEDIFRELGKNVFIYPFSENNFKSSSIDLTASKFAWTREDGKYIYNEEKRAIIAPAKKTVCILTNETIFVTEKIGGTYHSRMSMVMKGMGHIGTNLDPKYIGQSLIVMYNTSDQPVEIPINERIVSVVFHYLKTPITEISHQAVAGHFDKLASFEKYDEYKQWRDNNEYATTEVALKRAFLTSKEYKDLKDKRRIYKMRIGSVWGKVCFYFVNQFKVYALIILLGLIAYYVSSIIMGLNTPEITTILCVFLAVIITKIVEDIKNYIE